MHPQTRLLNLFHSNLIAILQPPQQAELSQDPLQYHNTKESIKQLENNVTKRLMMLQLAGRKTTVTAENTRNSLLRK